MENILISLMPKEGERMIRVVDEKVAKMALTLKDMIENTAELSTNHPKPVPLPTISAKILDKVIDYLKYHFDDPIEEKESDEEDNNDMKRTNDICEWDRKFIDVDRDTLFDLILAANFLNIKSLLDVGCKTAANQIKGKTAEEVRKLWGIECDLTPQEEKKLKEENAWTQQN